MKFGPVPLNEAEGKILGHNIADREGRRLLRKGRPIATGDIKALVGGSDFTRHRSAGCDADARAKVVQRVVFVGSRRREFTTD